MFSRKKHTDHNHAEHEQSHGHIHDATELIAATNDKAQRKKLLGAGIANAVFMACSLYVGNKTGAHPSLAEAVHDFSDVSFYMAPWLASVNHHIESRRAAQWMRAGSAVSAVVASSAVIYEVSSIITDSYSAPHISSIPLQAALAVGNFGVALYMGDGDHKAKPESEDAVSGSSLRHAQYDAMTSGLLTGANMLAQAVPVIGPLGALAANAYTLKGEVKNQSQLSTALKCD